jgi:hypothetical protein
VPPLHEPPIEREPPLPNPLLHKDVEEREMERGARVHGFNARMLSGNSLPDPFLHKCVEEGEKQKLHKN